MLLKYTDQFNTDLKSELRKLVKPIQDKANKTVIFTLVPANQIPLLIVSEIRKAVKLSSKNQKLISEYKE